MQNKVYSDCGYLELSFSSLSLIDRIGCGFFSPHFLFVY